MTDYQATDRQGHIVIIHPLPDNRLVLISQEGYIERREIITVKGVTL